MDMKKFSKPIHFTCPKCHADFEFAGGTLVKRSDDLKKEIAVLMARMQSHKNEYGKDRYYKNLVRQLQEKQAQYREIKSQVQLASEQSEIHLFILFKKACKKKWGDEVIDKMLIECEQELSYRTYDMAIQNHNNFNGA